MLSPDLDDQFTRGVLEFYRNQRGNGGFPIYRGTDLQYGNGFGDIFRSIGRFLMPILAPTASRFIASAAEGLTQGRSLREAARQAVKPAFSEAVGAAGNQILSKFSKHTGLGRGRRRGKKRSNKKRMRNGGIAGEKKISPIRRRKNRRSRVSHKKKQVYKGGHRKTRRTNFGRKLFSKKFLSNF